MARSYDISFEVTEADLVNYLRLMQRTTNLVGAGIGIAAAGVGAYLVISGDVIVGLINLALGVTILTFAQTPVLDRFRIRRSAKSIVGTSARFQVAASGIDVDNAGFHGHVEWSTVTGTRANDKIICLMHGGTSHGWIPAAAVGSADEQAQFVEFVNEQIDAADERRAAKKSS